MSRHLAAIASLCVGLCSPLTASTTAKNAVTFKLRSGRPVVDGVYINGRGPFRFLIDTGATANHIDRNLAQSIGLTPTFEKNVVTSSGTTMSAGHEGSEVRLGSAVADRQVFLFAGMDVLHDVSGDLQGILGQSFLSRFDYRLDVAGSRLEFGQFGFDGTGTLAPFRVVQGRPVVRTSLGAMVLDSGAHAVIRFRVRPMRVTQEFISASGQTPVGTVDCKLAINDHTFWRGDAVALPNSPENGADGLLPLSLFKSVYVNNSDGYVVLK